MDRFMTFLQAEEKGWKVKKGAKGIPIEKFSQKAYFLKQCFLDEISRIN